MTCRLSVIIVTYNHGREIGNCIRALARHCQIRPMEVLVSDNGSRDDSVDRLTELAGEFNSESFGIQVHRNDGNLGFTRAVNQGLARSRGEYLLLLNPDTEIQPGSIELLTDFLRDVPDFGAAAPQLRYENDAIQPSCRRFPRYRYLVFELLGLNRLFPGSAVFNAWKMGDFDHLSARDVDQPQGACLLISRLVLQGMPGLDPRFFVFFSDVDLCRQIRQRGLRIRFLPEAKVVHLKGGAVYESRPASIWWSHVDFVRYFLKWYRLPYQWILNLPGVPFVLFLGVMRWCFHVLFRER